MLFAALLMPLAVHAQDAVPAFVDPIVPPPPGAAVPLTGQAGEVSRTAQCFKVINKAPYTVLGSFITDNYTNESGQTGRHRSNFNLESGHASEFCTYGPYYEGGKLELVIRTLVPVFHCKTRVDGDIVINGRRKPEGGTDTWAICR
ncbi:MAG: hypothetical protein KKA05_06930 [Alphaproteobacteria bacterium]|nr:hypothetical protein [Alphaproteobacteria bacterium]